jgi:hypothetical protein
MRLLSAVAAFLDSLSEARRMSNLVSMSDHDLATRGYDRETLVRSYIQGLGAR